MIVVGVDEGNPGCMSVFLFTSRPLPKPSTSLHPFLSPLTHPHPLSHGGTIVTYGGLARKPVTLGAGALIFKDVRAKGFWLSSPARAARRRPDMDTVAQLLQDGVLSTE